MKVLVINGPNMNLLGKREPEIYGSETLQDLEDYIRKEAEKLNIEVEFFQSNHEGEIIDRIHQAMGEKTDGIIINAGAFTHYSYAIRDAIKGTGVKAIEVHMSNVYKREEFRTKSVIAPVCVGQITGFGFDSYIAALYLMKRG
ncbi:3-dehydroquinate dehydratase AroQ [Thermoclostridium stercorarium subsp. stercorarium DSM 8532]|jgi:3-dehydroquinate dehydratase-2|uniref:3-dehydroquinate dehydratase n=3 Tax=Thermoclostridium stercorarium TaxID=1510 RepID=L7VHM9_THES1|nr:type II 3-dehydroquinate dehydratase [Thermoclostridium stercorarium]AGC67550.1 3-dehydroquinate dehydratase AroQ [Thermoclostridium stercorarium subsp. stercorarium DSM 8532]AGI38599.1 3-dehydroquinate dehydratase [Thermoclostridium stercorarium subsp. stercorarium DSM 8532]ANW97974.1 3-dehydroquinate dehydratase [Thermoclostridium stercorarium subsp. thermolacticum DSM 2910]ANX00524.1 3-dehydroquinate dehydratase [Thermoclostridium stercorarium subsp. leptospartum DSM 9219]UZQ86135.1 type